MTYLEKYLKYKKKYLRLKQKGGYNQYLSDFNRKNNEIWERFIGEQNEIHSDESKQSEYTTIGFEISFMKHKEPMILIKETNDIFYNYSTHLPIAEASCDHSHLNWIIETDGGGIEIVTPTFYVKNNVSSQEFNENIEIMYNIINKFILYIILKTIIIVDSSDFKLKNLISLKNLFDIFKSHNIDFRFIKLKSDKFDKIFDESGNYLGNIKNYRYNYVGPDSILKDDPEFFEYYTSPLNNHHVFNQYFENVNVNNINIKLNSSNTEVSLKEKYKFTEIDDTLRDLNKVTIGIEAVNIAQTPNIIFNLLNEVKSSEPDEPAYYHLSHAIDFKLYDYLIFFDTKVKTITYKVEKSQNLNMLLTFLNYELFRIYFHQFNIIYCKSRSLHKYATSAQPVFTAIKSIMMWFKFDIIDYIISLNKINSIKEEVDVLIIILDKLQLELTEIPKEIITFIMMFFIFNLSEDFEIINKKLEKGQIESDDENFLYLKELEEIVKDEAYIKWYIDIFNERIKQLKQTLETLVSDDFRTERELCKHPVTFDDNTVDFCHDCVKNYLDVNLNYFGARQDTFIKDYLVVEYRAPWGTRKLLNQI